jgi:hypothetical protein
MLRLVLLVVYLVASSFAFQHTKGGGGTDPLGLKPPPPPPTQVDGGGGADPWG